jgi:hypothetical protein
MRRPNPDVPPMPASASLGVIWSGFSTTRSKRPGGGFAIPKGTGEILFFGRSRSGAGVVGAQPSPGPGWPPGRRSRQSVCIATFDLTGSVHVRR